MGRNRIPLVAQGAELVTMLITPTTASQPNHATRADGMHELRYEVHDDFTGLAPMREAWNTLAQACDAPIASSYDYVSTWWAHYKGKRKGRIFIFLRGRELIGAVPILIDQLGIGPASVRVAKLACSDHVQMTVEPCIRTDSCAQIWPEILAYLFETDHCDGFSLQPIPADSPTRTWLLDTQAQRGTAWELFRDRTIGCQTVVNLGDSFEAYLSGLSRNQRSNIRKCIRKADEARELSTQMLRSEGAIRSAFHDFVAMHAQQWNAAGKAGHFRDWPDSHSFEEEVISKHTGHDQARLMSLRNHDDVVAQQYALVWNGTCSCMFSARSVHEEYDRIGLGRLSLIKLFMQMIDEGITRADLGLGQYAYQQKLGGGERDVHSLMLCARRAGARRRIDILLKLASGIDTLYYRAWYLRLRPRLRLRHGCLHTWWIRTRL